MRMEDLAQTLLACLLHSEHHYTFGLPVYLKITLERPGRAGDMLDDASWSS